MLVGTEVSPLRALPGTAWTWCRPKKKTMRPSSNSATQDLRTSSCAVVEVSAIPRATEEAAEVETEQDWARNRMTVILLTA
jgi:hypothetical protein